MFGRVRYIWQVNPNRRASLVPLWRRLKWSSIEAKAMARGITSESQYLITRESGVTQP
jgi:hypothetical protein